MITTVTDNSPQSINTSLFSLDKEVQEIKKVTDKLAGINTESDVISVNGKRGIVELTASDVKALPSSTVIPTTTSELENTSGFITIEDVAEGYVPLTRTINDKPLTSDITLTASDVGSLPDTTVIPSKTSELTNDSGFITESSDITGNAETATTADKVKNALTVNGKTYDGSSAVDAGVQTVENGGTGVTTQADINKAFIGNLVIGESDVTDGTEFVSSYASDNSFSEPGYVNTPLRRKFSAVWNYIKGKISSVLGLTKDNYGGNAATADKAIKDSEGNIIATTYATKANLADKQDFRIFNSLEEFNEKKGTSLTVVSGIDNMKDIANAMSNGEILIIIVKYESGSEVYFGLTTSTGWAKMFTFIKSNGLCDVECRTTRPLTIKRVLNSDGVVGDWQELATTDSTLKTIQLSGSVDCNTLIEPGLYTASAGAVISITNTPANIGSAVQLDGGFSVLVTKTNVDSVYYGMQMFIQYGSDVPFIRKSYYLNGQYWTPWEQVATMDKVAHEVDTSYMSNGVLNISSIRQSLGVGCYEIMGQGHSGHGSVRLNIWQVISGAFAFSCCITDTSGVRSICNNEGDSPTIDVGTSYFATTNKIIKIF